MRKLIMLVFSVLTIVLITGCTAGIDSHGAGIKVGYSDSNHYSA